MAMEDQPAANKKQDMVPDPVAPREQLAAIYDAYATRLYRYALMILANPSAAEDVVQQVFAKLATMDRQIYEITCFNGYLRTAVRNECYRFLRQSQYPNSTDKCSAAMLRAAEKKADYGDLQRVIEQALRTLPADQREVIYMKVYEGMTFQQISEALAVSINTVTGRYRYAIDKLHHYLRPYYQKENQQND